VASRVKQLDEVLYKIDPDRFPLPEYLQDDADADLDQWLDDDGDEMGPPAAAPPAPPAAEATPEAEAPRDKPEAPPIDIDDVGGRPQRF